MQLWFTLDRGQGEGPLDTAAVLRKYVTGGLSEEAIIREVNAEEFVPIGQVFKRPPPPEPLTTPDPEPHVARFFLLHFWRGDYPLAITFWIGSLGMITGLFVLKLLEAFADSGDFTPALALLLTVPGWVGFVIAVVVQTVATYRSAARYRAQRSPVGLAAWPGRLGQLAAMGGFAAGVAIFVLLGAPELNEAYGIAYQNDPEIPDFALRVMRGESELELSGGLKYGLADALAAMLREHPGVRVVHLNSVGGRLGEADKVGEMIRLRGLTTYTSRECVSACTVVFAAGKERWLKDGAALGYHSSAFGSRDYGEETRSSLLRLGVGVDFADRAAATSSDDMWYPKTSELQDNDIISGVVDRYKFAASGYGDAADLEVIKDVLRDSPVLEAMEEKDPPVFQQAALGFQRGYLDGRSEGELLDELRETTILPYLAERITKAETTKLKAFALLLADQYQAMGKPEAGKEEAGRENAESCYLYATGSPYGDVPGDLPWELLVGGWDLVDEVLRSSGDGGAQPADQVIPILEREISMLGDPLAVRLLAEPNSLTSGDYESFCNASVALLRRIAALPPDELRTVMLEVLKPHAIGEMFLKR